MKIHVETQNEKETMEFAEKMGKSVKPPCVISLIGDLGAGKTTFSKGFAKGFGVKEIITSPTYTILNEYDGEGGKLFHFDMYRLNGIEEARSSGFEEYFDLTKLKGVVLIEWAENTKGILPERRFDVELIKKEDGGRVINVIPKGLV